MGNFEIPSQEFQGDLQVGCAKFRLGSASQPGGCRMSSKRVVLVIAVLFCLFAFGPSPLFAQSLTTGAVSGVVTDPTGALSTA